MILKDQWHSTVQEGGLSGSYTEDTTGTGERDYLVTAVRKGRIVGLEESVKTDHQDYIYTSPSKTAVAKHDSPLIGHTVLYTLENRKLTRQLKDNTPTASQKVSLEDRLPLFFLDSRLLPQDTLNYHENIMVDAVPLARLVLPNFVFQDTHALKGSGNFQHVRDERYEGQPCVCLEGGIKLWGTAIEDDGALAKITFTGAGTFYRSTEGKGFLRIEIKGTLTTEGKLAKENVQVSRTGTHTVTLTRSLR